MRRQFWHLASLADRRSALLSVHNLFRKCATLRNVLDGAVWEIKVFIFAASTASDGQGGAKEGLASQTRNWGTHMQIWKKDVAG